MGKRFVWGFITTFLLAQSASFCAQAEAYSDPQCDATCANPNYSDPTSFNQLASQCSAYNAASDAAGFEKVLLPLDIAATGICYGACFAVIAKGVVDKACSTAASTASSLEAADTFLMKSSAVSKALDATLAAAGIVGGLAGFKAGSDKAKKLDACFNAAVMTALSTARGIDHGKMDDSKKKACNMIKLLYSAIKTADTMKTLTGTATVSGGNTGVSGGQGGSTTPGGNAIDLTCAQRGLGKDGCGLPARFLASPDAQILNSGLAAEASSGDSSGNPGKILAALDSGIKPNEAIKKALGGDAPAGELGKALENLADQVQAHASELGSAPVAHAANGGKEKSTGVSEFTFGNFESTQESAPSETVFSAKNPEFSNDIWHANSKGSLFDIISARITTSRGQIENLDWSTPLNRALAGVRSK